MILGIIVYENDLFYVGEKASVAQEETPDTTDEEFLDESPEEESRRKSFIDDLLTLPKIKPEQAQKDELAKYFAIVERKGQVVEDRIKVLKIREQQLQQLQGSIDTKLEKLENEMVFFQQTIQKEKQIQDERLNQLVKFYEKMPAKKAAPVFEKMDRDLVVSLFQRIPEKQTMQILF